MAARQSQLEISGGGVVIRDLDSPGGTFVNRQRVLSGQARTLSEGDVIQLGGVQLRLVKSGPIRDNPQAARVADPATTAAPLAFAFGSGVVCHSWDEFLVISAQKWAELREELTSGRLAAYLHKIGRGDMAPDPNAAGSPDERLDAWIGRLPTTRPSSPELEVHPRHLTIPLAPGAGTRRKIQVSNTGFRLLRTTVRAEAPDAPWLKIVSSAGGEKAIVTLDSSEVSIEVLAPDVFLGPLTGSLIFEGNGGKIAVAVRVEQAARADAIVPPLAPAVRAGSFGFRARIAGQSAASRLAWWSASAAIFRLVIEALARLPEVAGIGSVSANRLDLLGPAAGLSIAGGIAGLILAGRRGEARDVPWAGLAGAILGLLASAIGVASCRAVDSLLPGWFAGSIVPRVLATAAVGAIVAAVTIVIVPPVAAKESSP